MAGVYQGIVQHLNAKADNLRARSEHLRNPGGQMSEQPAPPGVATHVKDLDDMVGEAAIYRMDPPYEYEDPLHGKQESREYVAISAIRIGYTGHEETYIFPSDGEEVTECQELPGSLRNVFSHQVVADNIGYILATND